MVPKHRCTWQHPCVVIPPSHHKDAHEYVQFGRAKCRQVQVSGNDRSIDSAACLVRILNTYIVFEYNEKLTPPNSAPPVQQYRQSHTN
jgi:hypothetical protein